ncbi:MAG: tryptophan 2,3-dioxygenase [Gammaproteobacteria bacterium]
MDGFLGSHEPLKTFSIKSSSLNRLEDIAKEIPKLLLTGSLQKSIKAMGVNDLCIDEVIEDELNLNLAMNFLSFISHAYMWGDKEPNEVLPKVLAGPWVKASTILQRPPILSYASYCLENWYKINTQESISLDNVALITNFLGGVDEDWFVTIHVCIENAARGAITAAKIISQLDKSSNQDDLISGLSAIRNSMEQVNEIFRRMPEKCDPYIYYHRVRPFIFGTKDNPDLPNGLIYEGEFNQKPQFYRGETGAQSSIIPSLDGALQIEHTNDNLRHYLNEMRDYMPKPHRDFITGLEQTSIVRQLIKDSNESSHIYNACLEEIRSFRALHLEYAGTYINKQSQIKNPFGRGGSTITGTGGTPFMHYLKKHMDETEDQKI